MENMNERTNAEHIAAQALETVLVGKVEKENGKGLSSNDYTDAEKEKLAGIEAEANAYTLPIASVNTLGGIKVGSNLTIQGDGTLDATGEGGTVTVSPDAGNTLEQRENGLFVPAEASSNVGQAYPGSTGGETFNSYEGPNSNVASGNNSHAEGIATTASGNNSHAENGDTLASGSDSHAEGNGTRATKSCSHAEGYSSYSEGESSHAEGYFCGTVGSYAHAEGSYTVAKGENSHAEGYFSQAKGQTSHAEGLSSAYGDYSHSAGYGTSAENFAQTVIGCYNIPDSDGIGSSFTATKPALIIGNGMQGNRGDAFRVFFNGNVEADGTYTSPAADYAELFEWADGNINDEDRVGRFVTMQGAKIKLADPDDQYILGAVSATPSIIGDNPLTWQGKYANDEWGRPIYEDVEVEYEGIENGEPVMKTRIDRVRKLNPDYNPEQAYTPRLERPEWDAIGMVGKLLVRHDGTLRQGGFCGAGSNGIATNAATGYYVLEVLDTTRARIIVK